MSSEPPRTEEKLRAKLERLEAAIREGMQSGPGISSDEVFDRLEETYRRDRISPPDI